MLQMTTCLALLLLCPLLLLIIQIIHLFRSTSLYNTLKRNQNLCLQQRVNAINADQRFNLKEYEKQLNQRQSVLLPKTECEKKVYESKPERAVQTLLSILLVSILISSCDAGGIGNSSSTASNEVDNSQDGQLKCQQRCERLTNTSGDDILSVTEVCNDEVVEGPDLFTPDNAPAVCLPLIDTPEVAPTE